MKIKNLINVVITMFIVVGCTAVLVIGKGNYTKTEADRKPTLSPQIEMPKINKNNTDTIKIDTLKLWNSQH